MADISEVIRPVIRSKDGACLQGKRLYFMACPSADAVKVIGRAYRGKR
jgi:hypothetical protein